MRNGEKVEDFESFYEATKTPVFRAVLLARCADRHAAEDAVADAFEKAYLRWHKLRRHPNPIAWVIRTAINGRISAWRRSRRVVQHPTASLAVDAALDPDLVQLIRELPRGQREVLALRVLLDFSTQETAAVLGIKQGTVKTQLHRALHQLRTRLSMPETEEA
jgi:RNA polymerase sigma factor (sigma-70 family)